MNKSFKKQIFLGIVLLIMFLFIGLNVFSRVYLERYYINQKKKQIKRITKAIDETAQLKSLASIMIKIENQFSGDIVILDSKYQIKYSSKSRLMNRHTPYKEIISQLNEKRVDTHEVIFKLRKKDEQVSQLISIYKDHKNRYIITQLPLEVISITVNSFKKYLTIFGFVSMIIGLLLAYILASKISKPIEVLSQKTETLSTLDFSQRFLTKRQDEIGKLTRNIGKLSDALKKYIDQLNRKNDALQNEMNTKNLILESRKTFISNISHELKTPIALIQAYAEGLSDGTFKDKEDRAYYYKVILEETNHMDRLVKELIGLMKLEMTQEEMNLENIKIEKLFERVIKRYKSEIENASILIKKDFVNAEITVDMEKMEMAISNLLTNAFDHVDEKKMILLSAYYEGKKLKISVFNTGECIPEEELKKVWEEFYKIDKSRNRTFGGSGIGLSIVKKVFELHSFEYEIANRKNGVEFIFSINT